MAWTHRRARGGHGGTAPERRDARAPDGALWLPHETLADIVSSAPVGIAVFEEGRGCAYVNDYGRRLLGARTREEAARAIDAAGRPPGQLGRGWPGLEFREISWAGAAGQHIVAFQDASSRPRPEQRLQGLNWAVAGMAESGSLVGALDAIASEVKDNLRLAAANIVLHSDADFGYVKVLGGAGFRGSAERFRAHAEL